MHTSTVGGSSATEVNELAVSAHGVAAAPSPPVVTIVTVAATPRIACFSCCAMSTVFVMMRSCHEAPVPRVVPCGTGAGVKAGTRRLGPVVGLEVGAARLGSASRACCSGPSGRWNTPPLPADASWIRALRSIRKRWYSTSAAPRASFDAVSCHAPAEHDRVLERLRGALRLVRQHRMARVAEQAYAVPHPARERLAVVQRPAAQVRRAADQPDEARVPAIELGLERRAVTLAAPRFARAAVARHDHDEVQQPALAHPVMDRVPAGPSQIVTCGSLTISNTGECGSIASTSISARYASSPL